MFPVEIAGARWMIRMRMKETDDIHSFLHRDPFAFGDLVRWNEVTVVLCLEFARVVDRHDLCNHFATIDFATE